MTKAELAEKLALKTNINKKQAEIVINSMIKSINDALANGDKVELRGFGSFVVRNRKAIVACNPKSKEMVDVPSKKVPFLKAGNDLRKVVNA
jgi:integration host factor subunit beta